MANSTHVFGPLLGYQHPHIPLLVFDLRGMSGIIAYLPDKTQERIMSCYGM